MTVDEAKKILSENISTISMEILKKASEKILSELSKAEEKISQLEKEKNSSTNNLPGEIWKDIPNFEGHYKVSNKGRIKSLFFGREIILSQYKNKYRGNYYIVGLTKNKKRKTYLVHVLVAQAFIQNPNNLPVVNHKNNKHDDNRVENLEWTTYSGNSNHAVKIGAIKTGEKSHNAKLSNEDIDYIRKFHIPYDENFGTMAMAKKFDVCTATICNILKKKVYPDKNYKFTKNSYSLKLTDDEVKYIIENYKPRDKKFGRKALAEKFGVHITTIKNLIKRIK